MTTGTGDVPEAVGRRLESSAFTSGLTIPDFAACLQMGLRPVAFVQGFCVMQWSWYGAGSPYMRSGSPYGGQAGRYVESYSCPHGYAFATGDHRTWGQNYEQTWVEGAWSEGFGSAYRRLVEEAVEAGAHGVIGVVDTARHLADMGVIEFHLTGTAVVVEGVDRPSSVWTTYLAGQRLAKLIEAGFMPVSVAAAIASIRVWDVCVTEYQMRGQSYSRTLGSLGALGGIQGTVSGYGVGGEVVQLSRAHMAARRLARDHVRAQIGSDTLHGARMEVREREIVEGDQEITCTLRGTRVRRFKDFDPMPPPQPTVSLR